MKNAERKICFAKEIRKRIRRFFQNPIQANLVTTIG